MATMPRVARFQAEASSSSAIEMLKPWRSLSLSERTAWRRSLRDCACSMANSSVSEAMGMRPAYIRNVRGVKTVRNGKSGISGIAAESIAKENHGKLAQRIPNQELDES